VPGQGLRFIARVPTADAGGASECPGANLLLVGQSHLNERTSIDSYRRRPPSNWPKTFLEQITSRYLTVLGPKRSGEALGRLTCYVPVLIPTKVKPEQTNTLPYVLFECFKRPLILAILPRLFLITFRYSQAVLINIAVKYISNVPKESASRDEGGHWLIVGAFIVYVGMAVSVESPHYL